MLNNVMPQRAEFFNLLTSHTERIVGGANATLRLISGLANLASERAMLIEEVNLNETSADDIKDAFIKLLYESFTTPINRDQLHTLILDLDRVVDRLQSTANAVTMYNIPDSTPAARTLASLGADACMKLHQAVGALAQRDGGAGVLTPCRRIDALEAEAGATMRAAVTQLFAQEGDEQAAWHAVKMRRLYVNQLKVLDHCRRAAHTLEEILIENA